MPYDIRKLPKKYQKRFWILGACGFCVALIMLFLFYSGPHLKPDYFAVDSDERVYLSFINGVYLAEEDRFYPVLTGTMQSPTIAISDDDVLHVADRGDYTAIDLNSSAPKEGSVAKQTISADQAGDLFDQKNLEQRKFDEQDGINYRYKKTLFDYKVVCESDGGERLLFQMPRSEYVLNMVAEIGFALLMLSIAVFVLTTYRYASKHPEMIAQLSLTKQERKDEPNNG
jgi:hypothetical protein